METAVSSVVQTNQPHTLYRGDSMEQKYDATYHSKTGKSVVHCVAPPPMTAEEIDAVLKDYQRAFMRWWQTLPVEKQLEINARYESDSAG